MGAHSAVATVWATAASCAAVLALSGCSSEPEEGWRVLITKNDFVSLALLPAAQSEGAVRIWEAAQYPQTTKDGPTGHKILREFDCDQKRLRWLEVVLSPAELNTGDTEFSKDWEFTVPDSMDAEFQALACEGKIPEGEIYETADQAFAAVKSSKLSSNAAR